MVKVRIPICEPKLGEKELEYVIECVKSNWISSRGKYIEQFEEKFSKYVGAKYGVAVTSGTTALHLALVSAGIGKGDEVIIPTFTTVATANPIIYANATPVLVDAELSTWNINVDKIQERISKKAKAIMVVHIYGHPVNMDPVLKIAKEYDLYVIEDAAEAHGAEYKGKRVGALGDVGAFSFYANKIITTGEGGMVVTNNEEIAEKAKTLRDLAYGKGERRFLHSDIGFNYRMTNLQAAIGVAQMDKIDQSVETRRRNAHLYNSLLKDREGITLPPEAPWAKNVYWMYSILVEDLFGISRDELMARLRKKGVDTRPFFFPIHIQPPYHKKFEREQYPVAEEISRRGVNLPSGNGLEKEQIEYIVDCIISSEKVE